VADLLVEDRSRALWLVRHLVATDWPDAQVPPLDEEAIAACWAWETFTLGPPLDGVVYNEIRLPAADDAATSFRRAQIAHPRAAIERHGMQLAREAREMLRRDVELYPNPLDDHCAACAFLAPCIEMTAGGDPTELLDRAFRKRAS